MERINNHNEARFIASKEGIKDIRTPEYIIFRESKQAPKRPELPLERPQLQETPIIESSAPDEQLTLTGEKKKLTTKDSEFWKMSFKKRELKKEIQDEIENLQDHHLKISEKELNPYLEYPFNKNQQELLGFGDWHFGARTCDVKKIKETVKKIKKNGTAVILMGDLIENSDRFSVGAGVYDQVLTPMKQLDGVCEILEPIKGQCLVSIMGNHEFRTLKAVGYDPTRIICDRLKIPYAGFEAFVRMKVKDYNYVVYATHGSTGARFVWSRVKALEDIMRHVDADIVLMGHTHTKMYHEIRYKGIREKKKIGVLTGSFLKDDPFGYASMKNLPPIKTGLIPLKLEGTHWDCHGKD
jgi:predicted phosphodiesterase